MERSGDRRFKRYAPVGLDAASATPEHRLLIRSAEALEQSDGRTAQDLPEAGVVTMLMPLKSALLRRQTAIRVSKWATRWAWTAAALDGMTIVWMMTAGPWLDKQHDLLSMTTWDGHHQALLIAAACSLAALAVTAPLTRGFSEGPPVLFTVVVAAGFVSVGAVAGLLALVLPAVILSFTIGLLARLMH